MARCSRCGRQTEPHYGSDGLVYCQACSFYGMNKQCWRCRMYLPASELQQYKGMWMCPYCLQDSRADDRKSREYKREEKVVSPLVYPETCERCGRDLGSRVYIWNGRRLCKTCLGDEQEKWGLVGGGPMGAPQRISVKQVKKGFLRRLIEAFIGNLLAIFGIKRKVPAEEIVVYNTKMPISHAKPMAEKAVQEKEDYGKPQSEGLMKKKKKKSKKSRKSSSLPDYKKEEKKEENPFRTYKEKKKKK